MPQCTLITPPAVEPIAVGDAKLNLRVDFDDDDTLISRLIVAAREVLQTKMHSSFITQTYLYAIDIFPWGGGYYNRQIRQQGLSPQWLPTTTGVIELPNPPLISLQSVTYQPFAGNGTQVAIPLDQIVAPPGTPARIQPVYGSVWPVSRPVISGVQITYTTGFGPSPSDVPASIISAMHMLISHWYNNRESVLVGSISKEIEFGVKSLVSAYMPGEYW